MRGDPDRLPVVSVEIIEAPAVQEPEVRRVNRRFGAGRHGFVRHLVHLLTAGAGKSDHAFRVRLALADLPIGKCAKERLGQENGAGVFVDDDARRLLIRVPWVKQKAERAEECF